MVVGMSKIQRLIGNIKNTKYTFINFLLFALLIYFIFHAIAGNRGVIAYLRLYDSIEKLEDEVKTLKAERIELEHKVNLLKSSIDLDMLDEQARRVLGVAKDDEKVFVVQPCNHKDK